MKVKFEQALHLSSAAVTLAAAFGMDPIFATLLLSVISIGLAVTAGLPN